MPSHDAVKLPPQDLEAEKSVLGSLMLDKFAIGNIADSLAAEDFYDRRNGEVYRAIQRLWEKQEPIDLLSVSRELKKQNAFEGVGGTPYLTDLVNTVPSAAHIGSYAKMVKEAKVLRDLIATSQEIGELSLGNPDDIEALLDSVEAKIFKIANQSFTRNFTSIREELKHAYERIEKLHEGGGERLSGVPTGFIGLDSLLSGLQKSDLIIIGARPSFGKTAFTLDIGRHVATKTNRGVGIFSLEMSREQVTDRLIASEAKVSLWKLRTGRLRDEMDYAAIQSALDRLSTAPLYIDDTPSPNILEMRRMARRLQAEQRNLGLIIVDYLQLIRPRKDNDSSVQQVTEISRGLKGLARELNIPVIAISQLSRGVEQRDVKIPRLSDLRESGSIEQDADVVLFLNPPWKYKDPTTVTPEEDNTAEIIIAKHRNGPLGVVRLKFNKDLVSFENLETQHTNENS